MNRRGFLKCLSVTTSASIISPNLLTKKVEDENGFVIFDGKTLIVTGHIQATPGHIDSWKIKTPIEKAIMESRIEGMYCDWDTGVFIVGDVNRAKQYLLNKGI